MERRELSPMGARFVEVTNAVAGMFESVGQGVESREGTNAIVDARLVPLLDLSPEELDNEKIAAYFKEHGIAFSNQTLSLDGFGGERLELYVGPAFAAADFYFSGDRKNLTIVFSTADEALVSLRITGGIFDGYGPSDKTGRFDPPSLA